MNLYYSKFLECPYKPNNIIYTPSKMKVNDRKLRKFDIYVTEQRVILIIYSQKKFWGLWEREAMVNPKTRTVKNSVCYLTYRLSE